MEWVMYKNIVCIRESFSILIKILIRYISQSPIYHHLQQLWQVSEQISLLEKTFLTSDFTTTSQQPPERTTTAVVATLSGNQLSKNLG